jgi:hypothetical protein
MIDQSAPDSFDRADRPRSRMRKYIGLLLAVVLLAAGWSAFWYYAVGKAEQAIAGWKAREAKVGRIYTCGQEMLSGYPFRIEVRCDLARAEFKQFSPSLDIKTTGILVAAQIYEPTLLISEFTGPMTIAESGRSPNLIVNWTLGQTSVRGTPNSPERVSIVLDKPTVDRLTLSGTEPWSRADRFELHGRMLEGSASKNPVIEIVLRSVQASLPGLSPLAVAPIDSDINAVLRGLKDFSPKPWAARFREIQESGGSIDIPQARVQQGETIAVGRGNLTVNANGRLEGQLQVTVAGVEAFLDAIGADRIAAANPNVDRLAGQLDRLVPGLGTAARQHAGSGIAAGLSMIGQPATLEGRKAVSLPLRFDNGAMFLGPVPIGVTPALF